MKSLGFVWCLTMMLMSGVVSNLHARDISLEDRVAAQKAIEQVYWNHTIWPAENPGPKPSLDQIITPKEIRLKVKEYLRKSNALDSIYQRQITKQQLQAEMNRMAFETKDPELLKEVWSALRNDPYVIAECFARPVLIDQLTQKIAGFDASWKSIRKTVDFQLNHTDAHYQLPQIETKVIFNPSSVAASNDPSAREFHSAVYTGTQMIIWGGSSSTTNCFRSGGRYTPSTNIWSPTNLTGAPAARVSHTAVWTGSRMLVWGGATCGNVYLRNGGSYNPSTDSWTSITTTGAPSARCCHTAVWTGSRMVVWGGDINATSDLKTGGRYDPAANSWMSTNTFNAVGSSRVDLQACKLEYSIVSPK